MGIDKIREVDKTWNSSWSDSAKRNIISKFRISNMFANLISWNKKSFVKSFFCSYLEHN